MSFVYEIESDKLPFYPTGLKCLVAIQDLSRDIVLKSPGISLISSTNCLHYPKSVKSLVTKDVVY